MIPDDLIKWDRRFIALAGHVAQWSKDPSTKVGAVLVRPVDMTVISMGFNGFPRGVNDLEERYSNRPLKYKLVVHAELNAILTAKEPLTGAHLYVTLSPCNECAKAIIQSGIARVVYKELRYNFDTELMFKEAWVIMEKVQ